MKSSKRVTVGLLGLLGVLATSAWLYYRHQAESGDARSGELDADDLAEASIEPHVETSPRGVSHRDIDPATLRLGWQADGVDPELLEEVLDKPASGMDVAMLDLEANKELIPWLGSLVAEDEFGQAIAHCRAKHERHQQSRCSWGQDVVLRRTPEGEARVVAVNPRISPDQRHDQSEDPLDANCQEWARCVAQAWKGRAGPFPHGADDLVTKGDDGADYIALRAGVHHLEAYATGATEYRARYQDRIPRLEEKTRLREQAYLESEEEGERTRKARDALYHNLLQERAWLEDYEAFLRYLDGQES